MQPHVYLNCPRCGAEVEVLMVTDSDDSNPWGPTVWWTVDGYVPTCACEWTPEEDERLSDEACRVANDDPAFGVPDAWIERE